MQDGSIEVAGKDISKVPVYKRNFGMVFQSYALFPHMTIFQNVAFGLKRKKLSTEEISEKTLSILKTTGFGGIERPDA
jgi:ABC-type spermidine/putrescine transport systems, ATPase components